MTKIAYKGVVKLACGSYKRLGPSICSRHAILMTELEDIVLNAINEHISKLCNIEAAVTKASSFNRKGNDIGKRIALLSNNIESTKMKKMNLYSDYQDKLLTREEFVEYNSSYIKNIESMTREIQRLKSELNTSPVEETKKQWFQNLIKLKKIDELSRELLLSCIDLIYISELKKSSENTDKKIVLEIVFNFKDKIEELQEATGL